MRALLMLFLLAPTARAADAPIGWEQARDHVGEVVTVEGRVLGVHCSATSCLLAFTPTFDQFTAVVPAAAFDRLPPAELDQRYVGRRVAVHGTVRMVENKPEIVVGEPADLQVVVSKAEREQQRSDAAEAQVALVERLGDVLDRLDELTSRMLETQERMDAVLASLEQRTAALAAAMQPGPVAPAPTFGEPQPRPAYESLRTLKRGMSAQDVRRLAGDPLTVTPTPNGGAVWDYGYGRSISFDGRGRAVALVGFPAP
jgi:hypothetical protein